MESLECEKSNHEIDVRWHWWSLKVTYVLEIRGRNLTINSNTSYAVLGSPKFVDARLRCVRVYKIGIVKLALQCQKKEKLI